jgi:hypothetical protein
VLSEEETKDERQGASGAGVAGGVIVDGAGREHPVDVIVYATGFRVKDAMEQVRVVGLNGLDLQARYRCVLWWVGGFGMFGVLDKGWGWKGCRAKNVYTALLWVHTQKTHTHTHARTHTIQRNPNPQRRGLVLVPGRGDNGHA